MLLFPEIQKQCHTPLTTSLILGRQDDLLQLDDPYNTCLKMTITIRADHQLPLTIRADRVAGQIRMRRRPAPPQHFAYPSWRARRAPRPSAPVNIDSAPAAAVSAAPVSADPPPPAHPTQNI